MHEKEKKINFPTKQFYCNASHCIHVEEVAREIYAIGSVLKLAKDQGERCKSF